MADKKKLEKILGEEKPHSSVSLELLEVEEAVRQLLRSEQQTDQDQGNLKYVEL